MTATFAVSKHDEGGGVIRLAVRGEIDHDVSDALAAIVANAAAQPGVSSLVVDLERVPFLAAAGIRALVEGRAAALQQHCGYQVVNARGVVHGVLATTGLLGLFDTRVRRSPAHR
ncbi:Anti-sigma F factor antagonist [Actinoplanes sp. SE50]|uniref:STAS domain-containing protein n=1 Tax=unclassified Actinoplanes TaxID=2626549 RepID=UPI00023EC25A|nr:MULTISPECIES: STAS domain-containing protein [unclassified Actinoplanes]AEV83556.1 Anti-sigma F factor antagonist [Actinoplanes sp. SE50/110]ATO82300.1 Anti-sigma F factor antagonist [Actinoplanes sp. SE50]SLL99707.1 anti-sigma F factor antagonist [Actinoplanes sp. SE50/110]